MEMEKEMEMVSCLILLSGSTQNDNSRRVFACKTCNKEFPSFQALGGHRASHRRSGASDGHAPPSPIRRAKPATHDCPVCGAEFAVGQALGGHMRKHRGGGRRSGEDQTAALHASPVAMKRPGGGIGKRVLCLDLNLTPLENEDLKLELGRMIF